MNSFVEKTLSAMGLPGAIISVLIGVIIVLAGIIAYQYRRDNKIYGYRLQERDTLKDTLNDTANANKDLARSTSSYSESVRDLAMAMREQSAAFETLSERIKLQYDFLKDDASRQHSVISSSSEAVRVLTGTLSEVRTLLGSVLTNTIELKEYMAKPRYPRDRRQRKTKP